MSEESSIPRREVIEAAFEEHAEAPQTEVAASVETAAPAATETPEQIAARARDEKGRFAPKDSATQAPAQTGTAALPAASTPAVAEPRAKRPDSWKKDYWDHWEKLDPKVAEYIAQREKEYQGGVSTYRAEAERSRELQEAVAPFLPKLQEHGLQVGNWIRSLGQAHETLALGSPQDKMAMFQRLAQEYKLPARLAVQDANGQWQLAGQYQQVPPPQQDVSALVKAQFQEHLTQQEIQNLQSDTAKYPHFEEVRQTMAGLLQSGLAQDLPTAYEAALKLPQHSDLAASDALQRTEADARRKAEEAAAVASRARAKTISTKSATPSATAGNSDGKKDRRAIISEQLDAVLGGRV